MLAVLVLEIGKKPQCHGRETHRRKLGIQHCIRHQDISQADLLRREKVGKQQDLVDKADRRPDVLKDGRLYALTTNDSQAA